MEERGKILFLLEHLSHVLRAESVIKCLEKLKFRTLTISMGNYYAEKELAERGIRHKLLEEYYSEDTQREESELRKEIFNKCKENPPHTFLGKSSEYHILQHLWKTIHQFLLVKKVISEEKPNLGVFVSDTNLTCRIMGAIGKENAIPILYLQEGIYQKKLRPYSLAGADIFAAWGEPSKQIFIECGIEEEKIVITGNPQYDSLVENLRRREEEINKEVRERLKISNDSKLVLFTPAPIGWGISRGEYEFLIREVCRQIAPLEDVCLIIKIHPKEEQRGEVSALIDERLKGKIRITGVENTYDLLVSSDVVVVQLTTVGLDAMLLNKPVIFVNFTGRCDLIDFAERGGAVGVYKVDELKEKVSELLFNEEIRNTWILKGKAYLCNRVKLDGRATQRVVDLIIKMVKASKTN